MTFHLLVERRGHAAQRFGFEYARLTDGVTIGHDPTCDVVLEGPGVEPLHARYVAQGHHNYVEVVAGTVDIQGVRFVPGQRRRCEMSSFQIGEHTLWYEPSSPAIAPVAPAPVAPAPEPEIPLPDGAMVMATLIREIEKKPERSGDVLFAVPRSLAPLFLAMATHVVREIVGGPFRISDRLFGSELPTFIKGDLYGEVDLDRSKTREDVFVVGMLGDETVVLPRSGFVLRDEPFLVNVQRGTETRGVASSLAELLANEVARARRSKG